MVTVWLLFLLLFLNAAQSEPTTTTKTTKELCDELMMEDCDLLKARLKFLGIADTDFTTRSEALKAKYNEHKDRVGILPYAHSIADLYLKNLALLETTLHPDFADLDFEPTTKNIWRHLNANALLDDGSHYNRLFSYETAEFTATFLDNYFEIANPNRFFFFKYCSQDS